MSTDLQHQICGSPHEPRRRRLARREIDEEIVAVAGNDGLTPAQGQRQRRRTARETYGKTANALRRTGLDRQVVYVQNAHSIQHRKKGERTIDWRANIPACVAPQRPSIQTLL